MGEHAEAPLCLVSILCLFEERKIQNVHPNNRAQLAVVLALGQLVAHVLMMHQAAPLTRSLCDPAPA